MIITSSIIRLHGMIEYGSNQDDLLAMSTNKKKNSNANDSNVVFG